MAYETFPVTVEFPWVEVQQFATIVTPFDSGDVQIRAKYARPRRRWSGTLNVATATEAMEMRAFIRDHVGGSTPFYIALVDDLPPPYIAPTLGTSAGGSLGSRTRYVNFTWSDGSGETAGSYQQASLALTNGYRLTVTVPTFPTNVTQANVYVGATTNVLYEQTTPITASGGTWTEPESGYVSGSAYDLLPTTSTFDETALVRFVEDAIEVSKLSAVHYSFSLTVEELFE